MKSYKSGHPRLLFDNSDIKNLKGRIRADVKVKLGYERLIETANELLKDELYQEKFADAERTQHGKYGVPGNQIRKMGMTLGLAYQITREKQYAEKLKKALLHYSTYHKWYGSGIADNIPAWHSELSTTCFTYGFALGYDCIFDFLSADERNIITEAVCEKGIRPIMDDWILPGSRIHSLDSMGHNWWAVCVGHAAFAALAFIDEIPEATGWVELAEKSIPLWFDYAGSALLNKSRNFDKMGGFYEGAGYCNYGIGELMNFRLASINIFGKSTEQYDPMIKKIMDFLLVNCYPVSNGKDPFLTVNIGDCKTDENLSMSVRVLLACGFDNPGLRWYLNRKEPNYDCMDLLYTDNIRNGQAMRPDSRLALMVYADIGWAIMRNSWKDDSTLLAIKSGFSWNHAHADAGTFVLFHRGVPLLIDSGFCSYGNKEYLQYYCQSRAHNVTLFDHKGQDANDIYYGSKESGRIIEVSKNDWLKYVCVDAGGPMSRYFTRDYRNFIWIGNLLLIIDDIRSRAEGEVECLYHYEGTAVIDEKVARVDNDGVKADIQCIYPECAVFKTEEGFKEQHPDQSVTYLSLEAPCKDSVQIITAVCLYGDSEADDKVEIRPLQGENMIGVEINNAKSRTKVFFNMRADGRCMHINSCNAFGGYETDAYILAVNETAEGKRNLFPIYASYLRENEKPLWESLVKKTCEVVTKDETNHAE